MTNDINTILVHEDADVTRMSHARAISAWLFVVCGMILGMIVLGGLTRLTHSGLSMVHWQPVTGWLPPLNDAEWNAVFDAYKGSPEFTKVNYDMTVDGFKGIFWLEFIHRLLGRTVGVAFFLPFLFFNYPRFLFIIFAMFSLSSCWSKFPKFMA